MFHFFQSLHHQQQMRRKQCCAKFVGTERPFVPRCCCFSGFVQHFVVCLLCNILLFIVCVCKHSFWATHALCQSVPTSQVALVSLEMSQPIKISQLMHILLADVACAARILPLSLFWIFIIYLDLLPGKPVVILNAGDIRP